MKKVIGRSKLTYDELITILVEVEAVLNSRPLMYVSTEDYEEPLIPFHLLAGYQLINLPDFSNSEEDPYYVGTTDPVTLT